MAPTTPSSRLSLFALLAVLLAVIAYRGTHIGPNELSWDAFGYYVHLPATFVHGDPLLRDISWLHKLMEERPEVTGTLYQITTAPDGRPMYFFLMGLAILYTPFFLLGHGIAWLTGAPMDGFSAPYQWTMALGMIVYTAIGLLYFRRILLRFFPDRTAAWVLLLVTMGTNWFHFMTVKNLETANVLFTLVAALVWHTMEWHRNERSRHLIWIAITLGLISLVKPSEILAVLIPVLWGVHSKESWQAKWRMVVRQRIAIFRALGVGLLVLLPQMAYWWWATGSPLFDSYQNPGIGLDLWQPHMYESLFSFRKGWLLYTPIMLFALVGFYHLRKRMPALFPMVLIWVVVSFWIISSWTEWWYGASFSLRPMITTYVLLALPLGYCTEAILRAPAPLRIAGIGIQLACVGLNLFQTWQHHNHILDPYRTTKAYYLAIFGKTSVPAGAEALKSVEWSFDGSYSMPDPAQYRRINIGHYGFNEQDPELADHLVHDSLSGGQVLRLDERRPYSPNIGNSFGALTDADHIHVHARVRMFVPEDFEGELPCLVFSMERKEGSYGYTTRSPRQEDKGKWVEVEMRYMPPMARSSQDRLIVYVWQRSTSPILIDDLDVDIYVPL